MANCPKCNSENIKKGCCGRRRCKDCGYKWNMRNIKK